ncbi:MAG TPA: TetR/AcrR family transcriptional regulator [Solirubrobacteraceae bacterium]|jgi:AcrR family transcriptional regulator|nr:TetR/AcrR family transcriptional regulator [Solirubrobacteraceae bacterium]
MRAGSTAAAGSAEGVRSRARDPRSRAGAGGSRGTPVARAVRGAVVDGPGRVHIGRTGVGEIQRARIIAALSELVRERGAGGVTVAHVVARSGVSRRTFYELFEDREDCFLAAFDRAVARASQPAAAARRSGESWRAGVAAGLEELLRFLDVEPDLGYLCVVGALGAGPRALERRAEIVRALVAVVHEGRHEARAARRPDLLVAEGVVGAVLAIVHVRLQERSPKPLLGLANRLMAMIALPYLGAAAAERELRRSPPRTRKAPLPHRDSLRELDMRITYRTVRVLLVIADLGGRDSMGERAPNNRQVGSAAGIADQGQISKLLSRLQALGLIANTGGHHSRGESNAWVLTPRGREVTQTLQAQAA